MRILALCQAGRDGKCGVIDFSIETPASYCTAPHQATKIPLQAAKIREEPNNLKNTFKRTRSCWTTHTLFEQFVVESGIELGAKESELKIEKYIEATACFS